MRNLLRLGMVVTLLITSFSVASAAFTGPFYDAWVIDNNGPTDSTGPQLKVQDSTGTCTDTQLTYFQFDVSVFGNVSAASLILTHGATLNGINTNPVLTLYGVADFDPATLTGSNNPTTAGAEVIQNITIPSSTTQGTKITWGGNDVGLRNYIQSQVDTDDIVTLALSFSANCNAVNSEINFYSQEYATNPANRPVLTVEGTKPNAVTIADSTAQQTNSLPLYAGLGALALVAAIGVSLSRRRTAAR